MVYPGATHSRFAHSIGVYHTARQIVCVIKRKQSDTYDSVRARVALLAALLHDIGHGPFSHAFEGMGVGEPKRHEDWSVEVIRDHTEVNSVLGEVDTCLPDEISNLLKRDAGDIFTSVVTSKFDADRLDYIQRDRQMTGVGYGDFDRDWLLDCLEVGSLVIGRGDGPTKVPILYLDPKGMSVAEEYLEARYRLYCMVYMHKTTRAAEKMLEALLNLVASVAREGHFALPGPLCRYLTTESPSLGDLLCLDDAVVWASVAELKYADNGSISNLAGRLVDRKLFKCVDLRAGSDPVESSYLRLRLELKEHHAEWAKGLLFDHPSVIPYQWCDTEDLEVSNQLLVKARPNMAQPVDIARVSPVVKSLLGVDRCPWAYAPDRTQADKLVRIMGELSKSFRSAQGAQGVRAARREGCGPAGRPWLGPFADPVALK